MFLTYLGPVASTLVDDAFTRFILSPKAKAEVSSIHPTGAHETEMGMGIDLARRILRRHWPRTGSIWLCLMMFCDLLDDVLLLVICFRRLDVFLLHN